jgi:cupin 2 domain-containing protein
VAGPRRGNLFAGLPGSRKDEQVDLLAESAGVRIERIISTGQASPPGFWYDQPEDEYVVLLAGTARLRFEKDDRSVELKPGDWVDIPAHVRHRVDSTQQDPPTVWLVVHRPRA